MKFSHRYKRLNAWNKIAFWGSVASIIGLIMAIFGTDKFEKSTLKASQYEFYHYVKQIEELNSEFNTYALMAEWEAISLSNFNKDDINIHLKLLGEKAHKSFIKYKQFVQRVEKINPPNLELKSIHYLLLNILHAKLEAMKLADINLNQDKLNFELAFKSLHLRQKSDKDTLIYRDKITKYADEIGIVYETKKIGRSE